MGLFRRGLIYYARIKNARGAWIAKTLNTQDRVVARARYREFERREADLSYRAAHETTLTVAAEDFLTSREVKGCAEGTLHMYKVKLGHLVRLLGDDRPLAHVGPTEVDRFVATRLREGAARHTIGKELTALRGLLKVAKRAGKFDRDLDTVLPTEWSNDYEPRRTALTPGQVTLLVEALAAPQTWTDKLGRSYKREHGTNRAAFVAFVVATGARLGEALRAERSQIDATRGVVYFTITKTRKNGRREKYVPITPLTWPLLERVLAATAGRGSEKMFEPWGNVRRDLSLACTELRIPVVTPNDLRRTHANWLREAGVDTASIADVLGHVDSRMVEKVYGKLRPEQLRDRVLASIKHGG